MRREFVLAIAVMLILVAQVPAMEPAAYFVVQDIEYQIQNGTANLKILTNEHVDYIVYELENPLRIIIDPLGPVWCDFEESIYFNEGMVKSIKFIKGREISQGPALPYYPFDFVTVELRSPHPYRFSENDYMVTLKIGEEKIPPKPKAPPIAKKPPQIAEEIDAPIQQKPARQREKADLVRPEVDKKKKDVLRKERELKKAEHNLAQEKERLDSIREELTKEKGQLNLAKDEVDKKKRLLKEEELELSQKKVFLEKDKTALEEQRKELLKTAAEKLDPRPARKYFEGPPPPDYLRKTLTLDDCVKIAMSNSISVRVADERMELAKLKVNETFRELFPEFSLFWDEDRGVISDEHYRGRKFGLEFKQVIFHGGEQIYLWEQAKVNLKVSEENLNKARGAIIFDVSKAYYELAKAVNKYNYQKKLIDDIDADFSTAAKEYEFGLISQIDFMNIESTINQILHTFLTYDNSLSLAKLELNKTMNLDVDSSIRIDARFKEKDIKIDIDECVDLALNFKPEYRISYLNTEVAELTKKIAESQTFPQIDVFGKYSKAIEKIEPIKVLRKALQNEKSIGATVSVPWGPHTFDYQRKEVKFAPTVTTFGSNTISKKDRYRISLFDNMERESNIKDAAVGYKESLDELNKTIQKIHTDVREAFFGFIEAEIKIKNAVNNMELYRKELEVARVKKGLNEITFYDLIQAKTKLYSEKSFYTDALGDYYISVARINKAIGVGGYFD